MNDYYLINEAVNSILHLNDITCPPSWGQSEISCFDLVL